MCVATDESIEHYRQRQHEMGCDCECELVLDRDRIIAVGGDPDDPELIVFTHTFKCTMTRARWARSN